MRKTLYIASEVRSGSTFIAESISYYLNERFGYQFWDLAQERFSALHAESNTDEIMGIQSTLYLNPQGWASSKIMCKALSIIKRESTHSEALKNAFFGPNAYWIVIRRKNKIQQAISLAMAKKSGLYHYYGDPNDAPDNTITPNQAEIEEALKSILLSDIYLESFASTLPPDRHIEISYENFLETKIEHLNKINALCNFPTDEEATKEINLAKIKQTAQSEKKAARSKFIDWFLENYH
ncbi:Stf0 family sulfotransferase [Burkholderia sp. MSMB1459WGS]|uniref:Stf0 family sulfotransferase n=1 Tax=Burkholderia sp. MSMB1459WGS TaxID=1637970 RepID=UPI0015D0A94B|nr:Stf0 family sulfotransferase [Burkholderia sp. MSMB1459WGS]